MPARPIEHAAEQRRAELLFPAQPGGERTRLVLVEVGKLYPLADVEGRRPRVLDEVGGGCDTEQAEREGLEVRILRAAVVEFAQRSEELVRREREAAHSVYLVDEKDDGLLDLLKHDLAYSARPALQGAGAVVVAPELFQLVFE